MAARKPFPRDPAAFTEDDRISFSREKDNYILEDDDGVEWDWNSRAERWTQMVDDSLVERFQSQYETGDKRKSVDEEAPAPVKKQKSQQKPAPAPRENTAVFVESLPLDVDVDELYCEFKKYGIIAESPDDNSYRIKLYHDEDGNFKGEALIIYHAAPSVALAIQMADGIDLRPGKPADTGPMRVKAAELSYKKDQSTLNPVADTTTTKRPPMSKKDKDMKIKKVEEMKSRLADWDDDDPQTVQPINKAERFVVLKHMFTLKAIQDRPEEILEVIEDIREEAEKYGDVTNTKLYEGEPEGYCSVRFKAAESAKCCAEAFKGRAFDGQIVEAYVSDGSDLRSLKASSTQDEEKRKADYAKFLEGEN